MEKEPSSTPANRRKITTCKHLTEDDLIFDLETRGINYLSRNQVPMVMPPLSTEKLISELIQQPNTRVRNALIPLLLAHPEYSQFMPDVTHKLRGELLVTLKYLYTAAVYLQQRYLLQLKIFYTDSYINLPDLFSGDILPESGLLPTEKLTRLGMKYQAQTGRTINWSGTFDQAARHLLRQIDLEKQWNQ